MACPSGRLYRSRPAGGGVNRGFELPSVAKWLAGTLQSVLLCPGGHGPPFFTWGGAVQPPAPEEVIVLGAIAPLAAASSSGSSLGLIIPLVAMAAIFYFLLIRPQQRRQRSQRALIQSVDVGDEVMTIGGIYGTVREMDDESVLVEVAPNVDIRFLKTAIARKLVYDDDDYAGEEREQEDEEAGEQS